jgi:hypothetical protein
VPIELGFQSVPVPVIPGVAIEVGFQPVPVTPTTPRLAIELGFHSTPVPMIPGVALEVGFQPVPVTSTTPRLASELGGQSAPVPTTPGVSAEIDFHAAPVRPSAPRFASDLGFQSAPVIPIIPSLAIEVGFESAPASAGELGWEVSTNTFGCGCCASTRMVGCDRGASLLGFGGVAERIPSRCPATLLVSPPAVFARRSASLVGSTARSRRSSGADGDGALANRSAGLTRQMRMTALTPVARFRQSDHLSYDCTTWRATAIARRVRTSDLSGEGSPACTTNETACHMRGGTYLRYQVIGHLSTLASQQLGGLCLGAER